MPFYLTQIGNNYDGYDSSIKYFESVFELNDFKKTYKRDPYKLAYIKTAESLVEILVFLSDYDYRFISHHYKCLCDEFGEVKVTSTFPNEIFNVELIEKVEQRIENDRLENLAAWDGKVADTGPDPWGIDNDIS